MNAASIMIEYYCSLRVRCFFFSWSFRDLKSSRFWFCSPQVNYPKKKNTFCKKCNKHTAHGVSQYKAGKASTTAQGTAHFVFGTFVVLPSVCYTTRGVVCYVMCVVRGVLCTCVVCYV